MLGDAICWAVACVIAFSDNFGDFNDFQRMLLVLGFIFVGTLSRFVSTYRDVHSKK